MPELDTPRVVQRVHAHKVRVRQNGRACGRDSKLHNPSLNVIVAKCDESLDVAVFVLRQYNADWRHVVRGKFPATEHDLN